MTTYDAHPSYERKDGSISKHPQSWTGVVICDGKVVRAIKGAGSKTQAIKLAESSK
jgi:hypothetical protein